MSKNRLNVGLLMTKGDADIAAYLNSLRDADELPARWLSAMVTANQLGIPFSIADYRGARFSSPQKTQQQSVNQMMFGSGSSISAAQKLSKWLYGWQVRGRQGEVVEGTVVNVSFCRPEVISALKEMRSSGVASATFLKELIRSCMASDATPTAASELDGILRQGYLAFGKNKAVNAAPEITDAPSPAPQTKPKPKKTTVRSPKKTEKPIEESEPIAEPASMDFEDANPLLDYI